jgi:phosphoribosyl-ATP pyrophosphohydrolase/phosphoribosyl-AMP cyclohydrolase
MTTIDTKELSEVVSRIDWEKVNGLLPVIVQDNSSLEILMFAYMNREALELSIESGYAHYYSRTRERLWRKGEESGHTQEILEFIIDCDDDTLLIKINQNGVACHTGRRSCFYTKLRSGEQILPVEKNTDEVYSVVDQLYHTILERKREGNSETSYTAKLLNGGSNKILKKVIEEAGELSLAVKDLDRDEIVYESADLLYHSLVALAHSGVNPDKVRTELKRRFGLSGIDEKSSRGEK